MSLLEGMDQAQEIYSVSDHEEEKPRVVPYAVAMAAKRPRPYAAKEPMEYEPERPDLARYFDEFADIGDEILDTERIRMCRAYASYLASLAAPAPKKKIKSKK